MMSHDDVMVVRATEAAEVVSGSIHPIVRPRTVELSENVRQESPVGFMVFAYESCDVDYMVFPDEREAKDYAFEQEEKRGTDEPWPIYALWASEWPNDRTEARGTERAK